MDDSFVAIDWGSSNFRAYLVDPDGRVADRVTTAGGVAGLSRDDMADAVDAAVARDALWCCGMIGSSVGWTEVPYLHCPVDPARIAGRMARVTIRSNAVRISPGLACRSADGVPDVMRGEEVLCLGALRGVDGRSGAERSGARRSCDGARLLCLPGTHTKWVAADDGAIASFSTSIVGELYAALAAGTVLRNHLAGAVAATPEFLRGVDLGSAGGGLARLLFAVRSRSVAGELADADAASFASGIAIGSDIGDAIRLRPERAASAPVILVGAPDLCALYEAALHRLGLKTTAMAGEDACIAGFRHIVDAAGRERV